MYRQLRMGNGVALGLQDVQGVGDVHFYYTAVFYFFQTWCGIVVVVLTE
jgi:hypothetical protein